MNLPVKLEHGSTAHRIYQVVAWGLLAAVAIAIPFELVPGISGEFRIGQFQTALYMMVAVLGLNLVIGYTGQISLGHSFFMGMGAYATAILVADYNWPYLLTIPVGMVAAFVVGLIVGIPALRIKGLYLALVTLGLGLILPTLIKKYDGLTGGANGKRVPADLDPPSWTGIDPRNDYIWVYLLLLAVAFVSFLLVRGLVRSRVGRAIIAIRDNETGAAVSGVNVPMFKVLTFGFSAAIASVAGSMFTMKTSFVSDTDFGLVLAIFLLVGLVVGGVATLTGAILGGLAVVFLPYWGREFSANNIDFIGSNPEALGTAVLGVILIILTFVMPGGIVYGLRLIRSKFVTVVPQPVSVTRPDTVAPPSAVEGVPHEKADEAEVPLHR